MAAYYNEYDAFTAAWLRELIKRELIADGEVDERSIADVAAEDVRGFAQCHFFAGIGGWSCALRLAGWPDDRAVWTGSCPCQPWSSAGRGARADDSRDLWPAWKQLIDVCRPPIVFGEQVASADGRAWLDRVYADLEAAEYAVGAVNLPAASVGAFHTRERLWIVADTESVGGSHQRERARQTGQHVGALARASSGGGGGYRAARDPEAPTGDGEEAKVCTVGNTEGEGPQRQRRERSAPIGNERRRLTRLPSDAWADVEWLPCIDGKARPVEPVTFPLAHGVSGRVAVRLPSESSAAAIQEHWYNRSGALKGFGNAIVPQVAQVLIEAYCDARGLREVEHA